MLDNKSIFSDAKWSSISPTGGRNRDSALAKTRSQEADSKTRGTHTQTDHGSDTRPQQTPRRINVCSSGRVGGDADNAMEQGTRCGDLRAKRDACTMIRSKRQEEKKMICHQNFLCRESQ